MKKIIMISVSASAFLVSCLKPSVDSQIAEEKFEINSPFENIDVAFSKYSIVNEKGGYVKLPDGGFINIPKNAFENNLGEIVKGGVVIEFRDFHNPAEIIASGIPMSYDSAGVSGDFQSAGMYEIRAFHNGGEVDIANGKSIEIGLGSSKPEDDYKFYDLKEDGRWNYNFNCKTEQNEVYQDELKKVKKQLGIKEPVAPLKADDSKLVFDFSFDETKSPELAAFKNILWSPFESNKNIDDIIKSDVREVKVTKNDEYDGVYNLLFTIRGKETLFIHSSVIIIRDTHNDCIVFLFLNCNSKPIQSQQVLAAPLAAPPPCARALREARALGEKCCPATSSGPQPLGLAAETRPCQQPCQRLRSSYPSCPPRRPSARASRCRPRRASSG